MSLRAVAIIEINFILLKAGMRASSHLSSVPGLRLPECHWGQSLSMKSTLFYWKHECGRAVILVLFRVLWLSGWHGGQSHSLKPPLFYWERKSDIRKSYRHRISNSIKVTAFTLPFSGWGKLILHKMSRWDCLCTLIWPLYDTAHVRYFAKSTADHA